MPSSSESGRARYTNSKIQGLSWGLSAHCWAYIWPCRSMNTASPGCTLRSNTWPVPSSATDSLAIMRVPSLLTPMASGRMPCGSLNANRPWPAINAMTAYDPLMRRCTLRTAANTSSGFKGKPRVDFSISWATTFSKTSESLSVLMWRWSVLNNSAFSACALVRFPLCTSTMPKGALT